MDRLTLVTRYSGSMALVGVLLGLMAFFCFAQGDLLVFWLNKLAAWLPATQPLAPRGLGPWGYLAGAYFALESMAFLLSAFFPRRWPYRVLCFFSALVPSALLFTLYRWHAPLVAFLIGGALEGVLSGWVLWLILLEVWRRPFAPTHLPQQPVGG